MKSIIIFALLATLSFIPAFGQTNLQFNASGTSMTLSQLTSGRLNQSTYPLIGSYFTFDQQFSRISIFYNASPRITIYAGPLIDITIGGKTTDAEKLLELNNRLGVSAQTSASSSGSSSVITVASNSRNVVLSDTTVNISNTAYWCACNVGVSDATLTFAGSPATPLTPGMCVWESGSYDDSIRSYFLPSAATLVVPENSKVQLITRQR